MCAHQQRLDCGSRRRPHQIGELRLDGASRNVHAIDGAGYPITMISSGAIENAL